MPRSFASPRSPRTASRRSAPLPLRTLAPLVAFVALAGALLAAPAVSAAADFTWSGADTPATPNWSSTTNWVGGTAPSNPIGTLTFPALTSGACTSSPATDTCYSSNNDLSGLSASALSIDDAAGDGDGHAYSISGSGITLGAGGISATTVVTTGAGSPAELALPIALGADQNWTIDGGANSVLGQLTLGGTVTGAHTLGVSFSNQTALNVVGSPAPGAGNFQVGAVTILGTNSSDTGDIASLNGIVGLVGHSGHNASLNGTDGNPVSLTDAALFSIGDDTIGPLSSTGGGLRVGSFGPSAPGTLAVDGALTLDANSAVRMFINSAGTTAGTDYSQLSATGNVNLGSAQLTLSGNSGGGSCPSLTPGTVDTLITTTGSLSGTFAGIPNGTTVALNCSGTAPLVQINYTASTVTATAVAASPNHTLAVSLNGTGTGSVTGTGINCPGTCSNSYPSGTMVTLTATPAAGSSFSGWSGGGCSGTGTCTVTMSADQNVTATFDTSGSGGGGGGGSGGGGGGGTTTLPPVTTIGSHPKAKVTTQAATARVKFTFSSNETGSTFMCKLDNASFRPCASPKTYKVKPGKHTFSVEATNAAGQTGAAVRAQFKVVRG
jgi:hypothetical protein